MGSILKKGLFLVTFSGAVATFPATAQAADAEYILPVSYTHLDVYKRQELLMFLLKTE